MKLAGIEKKINLSERRKLYLENSSLLINYVKVNMSY
ncbi:hypothetical protein D3856_03430 [Streptococcus mutans]|nr:hypothetical protein [Streptococcus mutans]